VIEAARLEEALRESWQLPFRAVVTPDPVPADRLTAGETRLLKEMKNARRRDSWLRGRNALKTLLEILGENPDTSLVRVPHPRLSLSHSGPWAVALGTASPGTAGVGVDLELREPPRVESMRFFLAPEEQARLRHAPARTLLRLWTVKEAIFKADPDNALASVRGYVLEDPEAPEGRVRTGPKTFLYRTFEVPGGFLTAALLRA
jgi:hypothetical protein